MQTLQTPFTYQRLNPFPLDASAVFDNLADFQTYLTGVTAYAGQVVAVRNPPGAPTLYIVSEGPPFNYYPVGADGGPLGVFWFERAGDELYFVSDVPGMPCPFELVDGNLYYLTEML